jgi:hypothetical protein
MAYAMDPHAGNRRVSVLQFVKLHPEWRAEGLRAVCEHCKGLVSPVGYHTTEGPEYFRHKSGETCNAAHAGGGSGEQRARLIAFLQKLRDEEQCYLLYARWHAIFEGVRKARGLLVDLGGEVFVRWFDQAYRHGRWGNVGMTLEIAPFILAIEMPLEFGRGDGTQGSIQVTRHRARRTPRGPQGQDQGRWLEANFVPKKGERPPRAGARVRVFAKDGKLYFSDRRVLEADTEWVKRNATLRDTVRRGISKWVDEAAAQLEE